MWKKADFLALSKHLSALGVAGRLPNQTVPHNILEGQGLAGGTAHPPTSAHTTLHFRAST